MKFTFLCLMLGAFCGWALSMAYDIAKAHSLAVHARPLQSEDE